MWTDLLRQGTFCSTTCSWMYLIFQFDPQQQSRAIYLSTEYKSSISFQVMDNKFSTNHGCIFMCWKSDCKFHESNAYFSYHTAFCMFFTLWHEQRTHYEPTHVCLAFSQPQSSLLPANWKIPMPSQRGKVISAACTPKMLTPKASNPGLPHCGSFSWGLCFLRLAPFGALQKRLLPVALLLWAMIALAINPG